MSPHAQIAAAAARQAPEHPEQSCRPSQHCCLSAEQRGWLAPCRCSTSSAGGVIERCRHCHGARRPRARPSPAPPALWQAQRRRRWERAPTGSSPPQRAPLEVSCRGASRWVHAEWQMQQCSVAAVCHPPGSAAPNPLETEPTAAILHTALPPAPAAAPLHMAAPAACMNTLAVGRPLSPLVTADWKLTRAGGTAAAPLFKLEVGPGLAVALLWRCCGAVAAAAAATHCSAASRFAAFPPSLNCARCRATNPTARRRPSAAPRARRALPAPWAPALPLMTASRSSLTSRPPCGAWRLAGQPGGTASSCRRASLLRAPCAAEAG